MDIHTSLESGNPTFREWIISEVRIYMKDYADSNKLLLKEEYSDGDIMRALRRSVNEFNTISPPLTKIYTKLEELPISEETLLKMAASKLLVSESIKRSRNSLTYNDGNLTINEDDKYQIYMQIASQLKNEYIMEVKAVKQDINIQEGMMGNCSQYATIYTSYLISINMSI